MSRELPIQRFTPTGERYKRRSTTPVEPADAAWHGTPNGYTNHGCGCEDCSRAWHQYHGPYMRRYRAGIRARGSE